MFSCAVICCLYLTLVTAKSTPTYPMRRDVVVHRDLYDTNHHHETSTLQVTATVSEVHVTTIITSSQPKAEDSSGNVITVTSLPNTAFVIGAEVTLDGTSWYAVVLPSETAIQLGSSTYAIGETTTFMSIPISIGTTEIVVDHQTKSFSRLGQYPEAAGTYITDGKTLTVLMSGGRMLIDSQTLQTGLETVIGGVSISLASSDVVIDGKTINDISEIPGENSVASPPTSISKTTGSQVPSTSSIPHAIRTTKSLEPKGSQTAVMVGSETVAIQPSNSIPQSFSTSQTILTLGSKTLPVMQPSGHPNEVMIGSVVITEGAKPQLIDGQLVSLGTGGVISTVPGTSNVQSQDIGHSSLLGSSYGVSSSAPASSVIYSVSPDPPASSSTTSDGRQNFVDLGLAGIIAGLTFCLWL